MTWGKAWLIFGCVLLGAFLVFAVVVTIVAMFHSVNALIGAPLGVLTAGLMWWGFWRLFLREPKPKSE